MKRLPLALPAALALLGVLALGGCASPRPAEKPAPAAPSGLGRYEAEFNPSDYDRDSTGAGGGRSDSMASLPPAAADTLARTPAELIPGFRVQLLATTNIDDVSRRKTDAEEAVPGEWFYVEFDPPTYKLRAGNFRTRFDADRFARLMASRGFPDAWTVPERVFKEPGIPPPPPTPAPADSTFVPR